MPTNIADIVVSVHPSVSGTSVITSDQIWVLFNREIDETTVAAGNLFVTGPDFDTWSGPDLQLYHDRASANDETQILQSPGYEGFVAGVITFERIALTSLATVSSLDIVGSGHLFRTKAIFTPTNRLSPDTTYTVHLSGDEDSSDSLKTGISDRTVFDAVSSGINTGTGDASFSGGYIGLAATDIYHVVITTAGEVGSARFSYYRQSDPASVFGPFRTRRSGVLLSDGVTVTFSDGTYTLNDAWYCIVKARSTFVGNLLWPFKTGSGSIDELPETTSTSVVGDTVSSTSSSSSDTFSVSSTSPVDGATNLLAFSGDYTIRATFSDAIKSSTVVSGVSFTVRADPVDGTLVEESSGAALGVLNAYPVVSGQNLQIIVGSGQLKQNNLVTVTLESTITSTSDVALSADYTWTFSTQYYPLYTTVRRMRLDVGVYIQDIPDDTINLAIHLASIEANALTWNKDNLDDEYYKFARSQWTACRAAEILLMNVLGGSSTLKAKRLGDLEVEYDTGNIRTNAALERALACQQKWEGAIMAGGRQVQSAKMVVKGDLDYDRPPIGRGWHHNRSNLVTQSPVANDKANFSGSRRYYNIFSRNLGGNPWWRRK